MFLGSGIRDGKKPGSGIRDKHPGSATLLFSAIFSKILQRKVIWFKKWPVSLRRRRRSGKGENCDKEIEKGTEVKVNGNTKASKI